MTKDRNLGEPGVPARAKWPRRRVLTVGLGSAASLVVVGVTGVELISRGVLPGKTILDELDGACSVPSPDVSFLSPGPSFAGTFYSAARNRRVGYTIAYPPGHRAGAQLPLVVKLHGYGGNHADAIVGMSPAQALALRGDGRPLAPMAMVTVDGGGGYWNPHPGDDPMAMVIGELIRGASGSAWAGRPGRSARWASGWAATAPCCSPRSTRTCSPRWPRSARRSGPATRRRGARMPGPSPPRVLRSR